MIDLKRLMKDGGYTQNDFSLKIGKSQSSISMICNGSMAFPLDWHELILDKTGIDSRKYEISDNISRVKKFDEGLEVVANSMRSVPLINRFAYASYSEHWDDSEFIQSMEQIPTLQLEDGNYLWFEVKGDSMCREENPSIDEKDLVLGRELYRHHWDKLQLRRAKIWVINHKERGLMIKEIVSQSTDGYIKCVSWNPLVQDFELHLNDINQLFYIKELRKTFI